MTGRRSEGRDVDGTEGSTSGVEVGRGRLRTGWGFRLGRYGKPPSGGQETSEVRS